MDNEEMIEKMLGESHRRGRRRSAAEVVALADYLRGRRWRRRANRSYNLFGAVVVAVVVLCAYKWVPSPEYGFVVSVRAEVEPGAVCNMMHQMLSRQ